MATRFVNERVLWIVVGEEEIEGRQAGRQEGTATVIRWLDSRSPRPNPFKAGQSKRRRTKQIKNNNEKKETNPQMH